MNIYIGGDEDSEDGDPFNKFGVSFKKSCGNKILCTHLSGSVVSNR